MRETRRPWTIVMIAGALAFMVLFLLLPLITVFAQAFAAGLPGYLAALADPNALSAIRLTLIVAVFALAVNVVFGLAASWCLARFRFPGRTVLPAGLVRPLAGSA
jgi:sulfate transport system permease protein